MDRLLLGRAVLLDMGNNSALQRMGTGHNYRMANFSFNSCTSEQKISLHPPLLWVQLPDAAARAWVWAALQKCLDLGMEGWKSLLFSPFFKINFIFLYLQKYRHFCLLCGCQPHVWGRAEGLRRLWKVEGKGPAWTAVDFESLALIIMWRFLTKSKLQRFCRSPSLWESR